MDNSCIISIYANSVCFSGLGKGQSLLFQSVLLGNSGRDHIHINTTIVHLFQHVSCDSYSPY